MTMGRNRVALLTAFILAMGMAAQVPAQNKSVIATVHNLSSSGPGEVRALGESQVCKFCHIPHNPVAASPLWGQSLSRAQYLTPSVESGLGAKTPAPQPDGSSRLCLSCHDGTVALGDVRGRSQPIPFASGQRLRPGQRGFLGTDLTGSHPISFSVPTTDPNPGVGERDMGLRATQATTSDDEVKLDAAGKMQCTTCHDPHSDQYYQPGKVPRFWVKPTVQEVCITCHELR
jgi:hypothetical protein